MSNKEKARRKSHIGLLLFLMVLLITSGLLVSVYLIKTEDIQVEGNKYIPGDVIISRVFEDDDHKTLLHVLINACFRRIRIPGTDSVKVIPLELRSTRIKVKETEAAARIRTEDVWTVLTENGIVLGVTDVPEPDLIELKGVSLISFDYLSVPETEENDHFDSLLKYASLIKNYDLPFSELSEEEDNFYGIMGPIRVILGNGDFAQEKIAEIKAQEKALRGLKGILHMEDYSDEDMSNRYYFEVE